MFLNIAHNLFTLRYDINKSLFVLTLTFIDFRFLVCMNIALTSFDDKNVTKNQQNTGFYLDI